ncbi:hypothetical protein [Actinomadura sp. WMMB 499]|uniref:hypothetical protein n=1 Tax=Actinomadura sp. WMMB 499 TaxID=1219491 RepID=UPI001247136A|nr:hypothetical protein [Actinomadura sp. WMMB 499]QFG20565.1 hypothetical protein F7P10_04765 [Actinomadura sp. WMMB 499]
MTGSTTVTGTSTTLTDVWTNGTYTFTVTALNAAASGSGTTISAALEGPTRAHKIIINGNSDAYIRATPTGSSAPEVARIFGNGAGVTVLCQVKGSHIAHPEDDNYAGNTYTKVTYQGKTGYMAGWLVDTYTSGNWDVLAGPPIWECAS